MTKTRKRTFAIGDIHGHWKHLESLLGFINYDSSCDQLIFLGDYIDRGENSKKTLDFIIELNINNPKNISLMGNHEDLLYNIYLKNNRFTETTWLFIGGQQTLTSFGFSSTSDLKQLELKYTNFLAHLKPIYIDEKNKMIFAHAGINPEKSIYNQDLYDIEKGPMWIRATFFMNPEPAIGYKVIFGHTPTYKIESGLKNVLWKKNITGIDTGLCYGNKLTALDVTNKEHFIAYYVSQSFEKSIEHQPEELNI